MAVTWDPSNKGSLITLTNGNLSVSQSAGNSFQGVKSTVGKSSGKWYFEVTGNGNVNSSVGLGNTSSDVTNMVANNEWWQVNTNDGNFYDAGVMGSYSVGVVLNGHVLMFAFDLGNGKLWIGKNGTWANSGDPAAGTGNVAVLPANTYYAFCSLATATLTTSFTANFGDSAFAHTKPTGFTAFTQGDEITGDLAATESADTFGMAGTAVIPTGTMALTETPDSAAISVYNSTPYTVTWNPSDKGSSVALSNGNLTATFNSVVFTNQSVRATLGRSTGKYYFEVQHGGGVDYRMSGLASANVDVQTGFVASSEGFGYFGSDGKFYTNNAGTAYGATFNTEVIGVAVDLDANKVWFSKSGTWQNSGDPVAGTNPATSSLYSGVLFPAAMGNNSAQTPSSTITAGPPFSYTIPTGYSAWNTDFRNEISFAITESPDTVSFVGSYPAHGPLAVTESPDTCAIIGEAENTEVNVFVTVGNNGKISYSEDGSTWTLASSPTSNQLNGIWQAGGGGTWIAVGNSGTILRSVDLLSWNVISSPVTQNLECVTYGNTRWIAVGWSGKIIASDDDGLTWYEQTSGTAITLRTVIYEASDNVFLAMGSAGTYRTSVNDGDTWDSHTALTGSPDFQDVIYCDSLDLYVAVAPNRIWTSPDAGNWTQRVAPPGGTQFYGVTWADPNVVVTATARDIYYSTNGTSYTANTSLSGSGNFWSAATDGTSIVIVGQPSSGSTPNCAITTDPTGTLTLIDTGTTSSPMRQVVLGDMAPPDPVDAYGLLQVTEASDTTAWTGNSDITSQAIVMEMAVTEDPDIFEQVYVSTTISGGMAATEAPDTLLMQQGGGTTVAIRMSDAALDQIVTFGAFLFNGGTLNVYSGSQPLSPEAAATGTLLATITLPDPAFEEAEDGECIKVGDWSTEAADTGQAGWFRLISSDGTAVVDGTVSTNLGTGDIIASTINFQVGDPVEVTSASFSFTLLDEE